jgi:hypothetical protein
MARDVCDEAQTAVELGGVPKLVAVYDEHVREA